MKPLPGTLEVNINNWKISYTEIQQIENKYYLTTNSDILHTYTWAWLTERRIIKKPISDLINSQAMIIINYGIYALTFNGIIEEINIENFLDNFIYNHCITIRKINA